jgi:hypothetical protein
LTANFHQSRNFLPALIGDGRPLISLTGVALLIAGGFAIFLSATGAFLPQDVDYLGMQVRDLYASVIAEQFILCFTIEFHSVVC